MSLIDTHCHLNDESYENVEEVIQECRAQNISKMICVGYDLASSIKAVEIADTYEEVYAAIGVHPDEADSYSDEVEAKLIQLANHPKVVAIGEIGLDYYWDKAAHDIQKAVFERQIQLANKLDLPFIVHNREAMMDTFEVTSKYAPVRAVMHCYSGSKELAEAFMKQGFYISLAGPVTFKNARVPKEVAVSVPLNRLLIETDCPYLAPHPLRGKTNYPYLVKYVAEEIVSLKGITMSELEENIQKNVEKLFKI